MRPLPEPMDGERYGAPRSTDSDVTAYIPRMDDSEVGRIEPDRAARDDDRGWPPPRALSDVMGGRHRGWSAKAAQVDDLPGPSRHELARLVRQVRALVVAPYLVAAIWGAVELIDWYLTR